MTDYEELLHALALNRIPQIGSIQARILIDFFGNFSSIFSSSNAVLENIPGIGRIRAHNIRAFKDWQSIKEEIRVLQHKRIQIFLYTSPDYPYRLKHCDDAPTHLYFNGNADLNNKKIIAVVGTRKPTEQGRQIAIRYIQALAYAKPLIISGLAYGIDYQAHRSALDQGLETVGVLANGLHTVYPGVHTGLAKEMTTKGGLLTEFSFGTKPDKQNFPKRNRLVAGMSDALLVVETDRKGGSMITADIAASYNRDIFAVPGRINDIQSRGCNQLIMEHKARLTLHPDDLIAYMNWREQQKLHDIPLPTFFAARTIEEEQIVTCLQEFGTMHIDRLMVVAGITPKDFHTAILNLELEGICKRFAGNHYSLLI